MDFKFYVYVHFRRSDGKPFYVGKGSGKRAWSYARGEWWKRVVAKHGLIVEIVEYFKDESEALNFEKCLIFGYRVSDVPLINQTDGGEGISGYLHSEKSRENMRKAAAIWAKDPELRRTRAVRISQNQPMKNPESIEKLRKSAKKSHADPVRKEEHRKAVIRAFENPQVRENIAAGIRRTYENVEYKTRQVIRLTALTRARSCRPFQCVETGGRFEAMPDAAKWLQSQGKTTASRTGIQQALSGKTKTAYGYHWRYFDENEVTK